MLTVKRVPVSVLFLVFLGFFTAMMQSSIFWRLGQDQFVYGTGAVISKDNNNQEIVGNLIGLAFMVS